MKKPIGGIGGTVGNVVSLLPLRYRQIRISTPLFPEDQAFIAEICNTLYREHFTIQSPPKRWLLSSIFLLKNQVKWNQEGLPPLSVFQCLQ